MTMRYVIKFKKEGYVIFTSHLDLLRSFKRGFRKANIEISYSNGFNPHPKMGFAQPLSLGYSSTSEYIEFETSREYDTENILSDLKDKMPLGIDLLWCKPMPERIKSLSADTYGATYIVYFKSPVDLKELAAILKNYLSQDEIMALKRMKKTGKKEAVDIKGKIRSIEILDCDEASEDSKEYARLKLCLDCGSASNCSPELVIESLLSENKIISDASDVAIQRTELLFENFT